MSAEHIIREALIEYDTVQPVMQYIKKNSIKGAKIGSDTERSRFEIINEKGEILLNTEVELLAIFYDKFNIWSWAWSLPLSTNAENYLSKEILRYALKLGPDMAYIKSILTTSRGVVKDTTQIDINLAVSSSIIKQPYILPFSKPTSDSDLIYYFILLNKPELERIAKNLSGIDDSFEE